MGYGPEYFAGVVAKWITENWLPPNGRIVEFGAQEFYGDQGEARVETLKFLRSRGIEEAAIRAALPENEPVAVREVYRALGIDYLAIDVDGSFDSQYFDLNTFAPPIEWRAAFDLVNNEGTFEHLINPINGFHVAHELLKVGGVAIHSLPLTGWRDHGLMYPTVKFYAELFGANRYEILEASILVDQSPLDFADSRFAVLDLDSRPLKNIADLKLINAWVKLALRKTTAAEFRVPIDHLAVNLSDELGRKLADNYASYSRARLTENRPRDPAGDEFERQMELQQRSFAHQRRMLQHQQEYAENLARDLRQRELEYAENLVRDLQRREHEYAENLARDLQQREHEHADNLARDLQQREHNQADRNADRNIAQSVGPPAVTDINTGARAEPSPARRSLAPISVVLAIIVFNGLALLLGIWRPMSQRSLVAFAFGFLLAIIPALVAWMPLAPQPTRMGSSIRHGARLAWAAAAAAFAIGCLAAY
jgi:hypothetical protein